MQCPECGADSHVYDTRGTRRRRKCDNGHRWTTEEIIVDPKADMYERMVATRKKRDMAKLTAPVTRSPAEAARQARARIEAQRYDRDEQD